MTPEEQRVAIAAVLGWQGISPQFLVGYAPWRKVPYAERVNACPVEDLDCLPLDPLPDYLSDLNAMHDAEKSLDAFQFDDYRKQLAKPWATCEDDGMWAAINATAAQRAEAFLRTLNLWTS